MQEQSGSFTSFDGTKLFWRAWPKDSSNILLIVHGFGEHSGRYNELVQTLDSLSISIYAFDLRGHGKSEGDRVFVERFEDYIEDIYRFRSFIETNLLKKPLPFILLGQSFGGLLAIAAALRNQAIWRALVVLSPFFAVSYGHQPLSWLANLLNRLAPRMIYNNPIKPVFLTHDFEELAKYKRDELIQRRITFRMAHELFRGSNDVSERAGELSLPILLLAAGEDHIVSLKKSKACFERFASPEKRMQIFDGCFHELLHERNRGETFAAIKHYLHSLGL